MCPTRIFVFLVSLGTTHTELITLTCNLIKEFVNGHNQKRLLLAKGYLKDQPAATNMKIMVWDDELAQKAALWASQEKFEHNPDHTIPSGRFQSGENMYVYRTKDRHYSIPIDKPVDMWFNEHKLFNYKKIGKKEVGNWQKYGHYVQMIDSENIYVGCAISHYFVKEFNTYLVVCNYGPTRSLIGKEPYKSGTPTGKLWCGLPDCKSVLYGKNCSTSQGTTRTSQGTASGGGGGTTKLEPSVSKNSKYKLRHDDDCDEKENVKQSNRKTQRREWTGNVLQVKQLLRKTTN